MKLSQCTPLLDADRVYLADGRFSWQMDGRNQQQNPPLSFFLFSRRCGNRLTACGVVVSLLSTFLASISKALAIFSELNAETSVNYNLCCLAKSYPS